MTHNHPTDPNFWFPGGRRPCWVCGVETETAYLDLAWQHLDCDMFPSEDGDIVMVRGKEEEERRCDIIESGPTAASPPAGGSGGSSTGESAVRVVNADVLDSVMSAGLNAADAARVMEAAAHIAVRELGDLRHVTDALLSSMNAATKHPTHGSGEWIGLNWCDECNHTPV